MPDSSALRELGYSPRWQALFKPYVAQDLTPARMIRSDRGSALIATPAGVVRARFSARLFEVRQLCGGSANCRRLGGRAYV